VLGSPLNDAHLLRLHLPIHPRELPVVSAVLVFVDIAWATRDNLELLSVAAFLEAVRASLKSHLPSIFQL
jgi:hypothetical protein